MINRILIRIKVVQLLYSHLLVQKDFSLESMPTPPTKERRFAYALYLDLLALMADISRRIGQRGNPLRNTRFIREIEHQDLMRSHCEQLRRDGFDLERFAEPLAEAIKESAIYKNYLRNIKDTNSNADVTVWMDIFRHFIINNTALLDVVSDRPDWSSSAVDRAEDLVQQTFANFMTARPPIAEALKTLERSLGMARELYFRLLALPIDLTNLRERQLDDNRNKYLPSDEDRNPNLKFVDNQLVAAMRHDPVITKYLDDNKIDWNVEDPSLMSSLLRDILESQDYREYMDMPVADFHSDTELWRSLFKHVIFPNPHFLEALEDKSVFWNDDIEIMGTFLLKTLKRFDDSLCHSTECENAAPTEPVLPMYKDEEDARFGAELMSAVLRNSDEYRALIDANINSSAWDAKRLAFMDVVVLLTAIAELLEFPKIPTSVTINEYIEIAKAYGQKGSGPFIHGMLSSIVTQLRESGRIVKP